MTIYWDDEQFVGWRFKVLNKMHVRKNVKENPREVMNRVTLNSIILMILVQWTPKIWGKLSLDEWIFEKMDGLTSLINSEQEI